MPEKFSALFSFLLGQPAPTANVTGLLTFRHIRLQFGAGAGSCVVPPILQRGQGLSNSTVVLGEKQNEKDIDHDN